MESAEKRLKEFGKLICRTASGEYLNREEAREAYREIILNIQPELQQGAFLMAHITRGPSVEELAGAWEAMDMYDTAKIKIDSGETVCDIVGTGSDSLKTVNCSTPASLIAAACGLKVAKKGARLVTGVSGASDILEYLGLDLEAPLWDAEKSLKDNGICYLPGEAFLKSGWARLIKSMRFTSVFNIIGPLTMPCEQTSRIVIGAYSPAVCEQLVYVLRGIGMSAALAPFGTDLSRDMKKFGMDEFSPCGPTKVIELKDSKINIYEVMPEDFGMRTHEFSKIASSASCAENAFRVYDTLKKRHDTALADFFCMNAAAALYISDFADSYKKGFEMAKEALFSGRAFEKLEKLMEYQGDGLRNPGE